MGQYVADLIEVMRKGKKIVYIDETSTVSIVILKICIVAAIMFSKTEIYSLYIVAVMFSKTHCTSMRCLFMAEIYSLYIVATIFLTDF
jgi:hypothetical protein